jgi:hypothetical protein
MPHHYEPSHPTHPSDALEVADIIGLPLGGGSGVLTRHGRYHKITTVCRETGGSLHVWFDDKSTRARNQWAVVFHRTSTVGSPLRVYPNLLTAHHQMASVRHLQVLQQQQHTAVYT